MNDWRSPEAAPRLRIWGDSMANEQNLISIGDRTTDEQREIGRLGGIASGEARRARKTLKETMELLLSMPISDRRRFNKAARMGFNVEDMDNSTLVVIALWSKAIDGDVAAIRELRSLVDEGGNDNGQLEKLLRGILDADV